MSVVEGSTSEREIVMERIVNAPREQVWRVWTEPDHIKAWWGPDGFTTTIHEMNVKVGGVWRFMMHGPDGTDYPNRIVYREIVRPERLVYDHDDDGGGKRFHQTVTFTAIGNKTKVVMRLLFDTKEQRDVVATYAIEGGRQTLARLDQHLATIPAS